MLLLREAMWGAAFLILAVLWPLSDHQPALAIVLGVIVGGTMLFMAVRNVRLSLVVTRETVLVRNLFKTYRIQWADVRNVRIRSRHYLGPSELPVFVFELQNGKVAAWSVPTSKPKQIAALRKIQERAPGTVSFPDLAAFHEITREEQRSEVRAALVLVALAVVLVTGGVLLFGLGGEIAATLVCVTLAGVWKQRHLAKVARLEGRGGHDSQAD